MRVTIERLRMGILALAGILVAALLLFFAYARWQFRHIARDLPGKLGISIEQSTNGYTFSRSEGGHTSFTLHAAKMVRYKGGGRMALYDVSILLYGAAGTQPDRIYGSEFDYDPASGVVRANGATQIDLQAPAGASPGPGSGPAPAGNGSPRNGSNSTVHLETADLVFNQKTGVATTPEHLEFSIAQAGGSATGADFNSRTGVLVLQRDVVFHSTVDGKPLTSHASHAQYDRTSQLLYLSQCSSDYASNHGSSDQAVVHFRQDGSAKRIDAEGHVVMKNEARIITSEKAYADLDERNQPEQVVLDGEVLYDAREENRHLRGNAAEGTLLYDSQNQLRHAQLRNNVSIVEEETPQGNSHGGVTAETPKPAVKRDLEASQIDVNFASGQSHRPEPRDLLAVGGATLNIHTLYAGRRPQSTEVQGDRLLATFTNGAVISSVQGEGHTRLTSLNSNGARQTSIGDSLRMAFAPTARGNQAAQPIDQLESAEQQGHVMLVEEVPTAGNPGAQPVETNATAQRATYEASTQLMTLYGDPRLHNAAGDLSAGRIQFNHSTGNALATGGVKATYRSDTQEGPAVSFGGPEPVHVIADQARLERAENLLFFYGAPGADARMWQGADSISAPVLELSRAQRTLTASGTHDTEAVKAVLVSQGPDAGAKTAPPGQSGSPGSGPGAPHVLRVVSRSMVYSDAPVEGPPSSTALSQSSPTQPGPSKAIFHGGVSGGVLVQDSFGLLRTKTLDVTFGSMVTPAVTPAKDSKLAENRSAKAVSGKQVERMVARGGVELEQPGRKGTGEQLLYTADGNFVLTGSGAAPPRLIDQVHGTVTGASLIFNDRDDSVIVSSGPSKAITETRVAK